MHFNDSSACRPFLGKFQQGGHQHSPAIARAAAASGLRAPCRLRGRAHLLRVRRAPRGGSFAHELAIFRNTMIGSGDEIDEASLILGCSTGAATCVPPSLRKITSTLLPSFPDGARPTSIPWAHR